MTKDTSPEERLLSLIKKKNKKAPEAAPVESVVSKADERISGMLKSEVFKNKVFEPSRLKSVNKYLVAVLGILILYFLIDLIFARPYKSVQALVSKSTAARTEKVLPLEPKNTAAVKDYSAYSGAVPSRTVFGQSQGGEGQAEGVAVASGGVSEQLGLVGIIAGDNPQAIIEDKKAQKTYYLNKGQSLDGYIVEEIYEDKVTLNYEGKKVSLFL